MKKHTAPNPKCSSSVPVTWQTKPRTKDSSTDRLTGSRSSNNSGFNLLPVVHHLCHRYKKKERGIQQPRFQQLESNLHGSSASGPATTWRVQLQSKPLRDLKHPVDKEHPAPPQTSRSSLLWEGHRQGWSSPKKPSKPSLKHRPSR